MAKVIRFQDLHCWQAAREMVKNVFLACNQGKLATDYATRNQLQRAALSVMNNIAEGFARFSDKEYVRFLNIAQSSAAEVKSMLYVLEDLKYTEQEELRKLHQLIDKARNLTLGLIRSIVNKNKRV